ncbi:hypothetical protein QVD17_03649 [Tagetes erecta]|uniref:Uncharacterized protein n=1 Tax=Tagetes erecta TaxID=13708 RepID=A0AAD8L8P9_TARER|nr:hypothetical protein QVD17_03649 [Tagetes erecta]
MEYVDSLGNKGKTIPGGSGLRLTQQTNTLPSILDVSTQTKQTRTNFCSITINKQAAGVFSSQLPTPISGERHSLCSHRTGY